MSQAKGRTPFTDKDIENLTEYLAVCSPTEVGRMGYAPYKALVENAGGIWPWSRRHTWQSWREQYKKNFDKYDRRIRKYQRRKALLKESNKDDAPSATQPAGSKRKASDAAEGRRSAKRPKPSSSTVGESSRPLTKPQTERSLFSDTEDEDAPEAQPNRSPPRTQHQPEEVEESSQEAPRAPPNGQRAVKVERTGSVKGGFTGKRAKSPLFSKRAQQAGLADKPTQRGDSTNPNASGERSLAKPKSRPLQRRTIDDDPFISSPSPDSPPGFQPPPRSPRRQPPKYVEGPFRNTLSTASSSSWPPARRKNPVNLPQAPSNIAPTASSEAMPPPKIPSCMAPTATLSSIRPLPSPSSGPHGKQARQQAPANAIPSSSKNQLPPGPYRSLEDAINPPEEPSSAGPHPKPQKAPVAASVRSSHGAAKRNPAPIKMSPFTKAVSDAVVTPNEIGNTRKPSHGSESNDRNARPSAVSQTLRPQGPRARDSSPHHHGLEWGTEIQSDHNDNGTEDVFTEQKPTPPPSKEIGSGHPGKESHAQRIISNSPIPHIDLKRVSSRGSRRQSSLSTTSRTSSTRSSAAPRPRNSLAFGSRRSSSAQAAASRDAERFERAGRQHLLGQMAKHYGFDFAVAFEAYNRLQDLDKTTAFLKKLRDHTDSVGQQLLGEFLSDDGGEDEPDENGAEEAEGVPVGGARDDADTVSISTLQQLEQSRRRRSNGPRHSLTIRPIPDEEVDKYALTVEQYSAPRRSRAGKYARHRPHIMPYSQTPGAIAGRSPSALEEKSPPQIDLNQYSSSPLKGRMSMDQESLPPSSPPRGDDDEEGVQQEEDDLELEYEDLFGSNSVRGTSPEEVEQELFQGQMEEGGPYGGEDEDEPQDGGDGADEDEDERGGIDDDDDDDDHSNIAMDIGLVEDEADGGEAEGGGDGGEESGHDFPPATEQAPDTDSDANTVEEDEPDPEDRLKRTFALDLDKRHQEVQRQFAHLANTVNQENKREMAEWEDQHSDDKLAAHHLLLCATVLHRLKDGAEKPLRLGEFYDDALREYRRDK